MGSALHEMKTGDKVEIRGPNQQWSFVKSKYAHYAMIAGGTGITPLFQATEHILKNDPKAQVSFLTFNDTAGDILLKPELADLQSKYPDRLVVTHSVKKGLFQRHGEPSREVLAELLPPSSTAGLLVMVCGRPDMTKMVAGAKNQDFTQGNLDGVLKELGYDSNQVWKV